MNIKIKKKLIDLFRVDKELVIVFLLVVITGIIFFIVSNQRAFLNFFYLPVLVGAYLFGKRYATHSAIFSIILISVIAYFYPETFMYSLDSNFNKWFDILTWSGFLMITGYFMGLLYEKKESARKNIERTYKGILEMLSLMVDSVDQYTHSHSYRVSAVSAVIAEEMKYNEETIENIRLAGLLHDLGKLGVSNEILQSINKLTDDEIKHMRSHADRGAEMLVPVGGKVFEILPLIIYHHERHDGTGYHRMAGEDIPLGARVISVADVYDALISDRPYRKAFTPLKAKEEIISNANTQFDPLVVRAFESVFHKIEIGIAVPISGFAWDMKFY